MSASRIRPDSDLQRGRHQEFVAHAVAHRVVHDLEIVQVDEEHRRSRRAVPPGHGELVRDPVLEQHPVGQSGQRVVERPVFQFPLQLTLFGHVPQGEHQAAHGGLLAQVAAPLHLRSGRSRRRGG